MSKTITLDRVPLGGIFTADGVRWVKLDGDNEAIFAVTESELLLNTQFEDDDADLEDHNNFGGSLIEKQINRWLRDKHKPLFDATPSMGLARCVFRKFCAVLA